MRINDYIKDKSDLKDNNTANNATNSQSQSDVTAAFNKYSQLSEADLMLEMFKVAEEQRKNGSLDNDGLNKFYENAKGFLTPEQSARLNELVIGLKQ